MPCRMFRVLFWKMNRLLALWRLWRRKVLRLNRKCRILIRFKPRLLKLLISIDLWLLLVALCTLFCLIWVRFTICMSFLLISLWIFSTSWLRRMKKSTKFPRMSWKREEFVLKISCSYKFTKEFRTLFWLMIEWYWLWNWLRLNWEMTTNNP